MPLITLPIDIRKQLANIGHPRYCGEKIEPWKKGERYKTNAGEIIFIQGGEVVAIKKREHYIWKQEANKDD